MERAYHEERQRELAIEMRQFTRGTAMADSVFQRYDPGPANRTKRAEARESQRRSSGTRASTSQPVTGTRYLLTRSKGHHSSTTIAKSVSFDGSLTHPYVQRVAACAVMAVSLCVCVWLCVYACCNRRLPESVTSSAARHNRRLGTATGSHTAGFQPLPTPTTAKFDKVSRHVYGNVA